MEGLDHMSEAKKGTHHKSSNHTVRKDQAPRKTRQQTNTMPRSKKGKAGPGRPKGSVVSKETGLTPNQERIAEAMLSKELEDGIFPASVGDIAKLTGSDPKYVRDLLKRPEFQSYLLSLLELEGVVLEGAFWRGMALGLQVGDSKVLELYAKMTGKITNRTESKIEVEVVAPGHSTPVLAWDDGGEIVEADIIEPEG
jgi:hypothetical protein